MIKDIQTSIEEQTAPAPASPAWIKGPETLASVGLQRALGGPRSCHRSETPPLRKPSAIVVCCPEDPEWIIAEVKEIRRAAPEAVVVVLGPSLDPELARAAVRTGARGFLHAGMPPEQVARAVSVAIAGETVLPRELLKELVALNRPADLSVLSARQREILGLVAEGACNSEIARRLYLSESTVKQHLRKAYKLLGVKNRLQAAGVFRRGNRPSSPKEEVTSQRPGLAASVVGRRTV